QPLCHVPDGGIRADVRRLPVADRRPTGTTRSSMAGLGAQKARMTTEEVRLDHGKLPSSGAARGQRIAWPSTAPVAPNLVYHGRQENQTGAHRPENPGNVGFESP